MWSSSLGCCCSLVECRCRLSVSLCRLPFVGWRCHCWRDEPPPTAMGLCIGALLLVCSSVSLSLYRRHNLMEALLHFMHLNPPMLLGFQKQLPLSPLWAMFWVCSAPSLI